VPRRRVGAPPASPDGAPAPVAPQNRAAPLRGAAAQQQTQTAQHLRKPLLQTRRPGAGKAQAATSAPSGGPKAWRGITDDMAALGAIQEREDEEPSDDATQEQELDAQDGIPRDRGPSNASRSEAVERAEELLSQAQADIADASMTEDRIDETLLRLQRKVNKMLETRQGFVGASPQANGDARCASAGPCSEEDEPKGNDAVSSIKEATDQVEELLGSAHAAAAAAMAACEAVGPRFDKESRMSTQAAAAAVIAACEAIGPHLEKGKQKSSAPRTYPAELSESEPVPPCTGELEGSTGTLGGIGNTPMQVNLERENGLLEAQRRRLERQLRQSEQKRKNLEKENQTLQVQLSTLYHDVVGPAGSERERARPRSPLPVASSISDVKASSGRGSRAQNTASSPIPAQGSRANSPSERMGASTTPAHTTSGSTLPAATAATATTTTRHSNSSRRNSPRPSYPVSNPTSRESSVQRSESCTHRSERPTPPPSPLGINARRTLGAGAKPTRQRVVIGAAPPPRTRPVQRGRPSARGQSGKMSSRAAGEGGQPRM